MEYYLPYIPDASCFLSLGLIVVPFTITLFLKPSAKLYAMERKRSVDEASICIGTLDIMAKMYLKFNRSTGKTTMHAWFKTFETFETMLFVQSPR